MPIHPLEEILHPQSIAVVGASDTTGTPGYSFTRHLLDHGYRGKIYPVNPNYSEIIGMKAYPSLREIPGTVDYVICSIPAAATLNLLKDCAQKKTRGIHFFTGRFSETGRQDAAELEQQLLKQAKKYGIRIIGPNCMGLYYPREGISFSYDLPHESGTVGLASQSGAGAIYFIQVASMRGLRFSKVISYGNAIDLNECDYLDYFAQDPETKIILMYLEGVRDGRKFFNSLRQAAAIKPVIIAKGGRGISGIRAAASHTAALAGSMKIWGTMVAQAGAVNAQDFDEMTDLAVSFRFLPPARGTNIGIAGVGGGPSVLAADQCEEAGLDVIPLPDEIRAELKGMGIPIWDWVGNPIDVSITGGLLPRIEMLRMIAGNENFDLIMGIINDEAPSTGKVLLSRLRADVNGYIKVRQEISKPLLVVVREKSPGIENHNNLRLRMLSEARTKLIAAGIPVYPSVARAAAAVRKLIDYYRRRS
ncbi:CoA-binding protein [Chloroflexota bacterium]